jgi:hypothetical protein
VKIAIFGARGMIGSAVVAEALARGHELVAVVRDPSAPVGAAIPVVVGDVTDADAVAAAVGGADAVVSAVGGAKQGNPRAVVDAALALIDGLRAAGVTRLVVVGGAGSLLLEDGRRLVDSDRFLDAWKPASLAQCDALAIYQERAGGLDWTYISPADVIEPGERTGSYGLGTDRLVEDSEGNSFISVEDYAVALVDQLEAPTAIRARMAVGHVS